MIGLLVTRCSGDGTPHSPQHPIVLVERLAAADGWVAGSLAIWLPTRAGAERGLGS